MPTITLKIEIEYESWFSDDREPKTQGEWRCFFATHLIPESSILGIDDGEKQDMVSMDTISVDVIDFIP